jgi:sarcosine oxidase
VQDRRRDWDAIVVGLGGIGSGAAYWLSRRLGDRVLGLERFAMDHANGASADHSRIIRLSYHRPDYVRLARRAYETWAEVEAEAGERVLTTTGGLDLWPPDPAIPMADYTDSLAAEGVAFETLDGAEVRRRWPQWSVPDDLRAMWQPAGGLADRTGRVVIAADAWTNELLAPFERRLPLTITKEQVTYYACPDPAAFAPDRFPVWIWMDDPCFYGFPTYGEAGPKAAQDCGGETVEPDTRSFGRDEAAFARLHAFLETHLPGAVGPPILTRTCLYTLTPDRDFVVDRLPEAPGVQVALGAAHGFKFASVLGRILAEIAIDGGTPSAPELERFRIDRPILLEPDPPTSWMV